MAITTIQWNQVQMLSADPSRLPYILLTYKPSFVSDLIRWFDGEWSHVVWHHRPHFVASQDWRFHETLLTKYKTHDMEILEFERGWEGDNAQYKKAIMDCIHSQIRRAAFYDLLGLVGHLVRYPRLHCATKYYCTEAVWKGFQAAYHLEDMKFTPLQLGNWLKGHGWKTLGYRKAERDQ